MYRILVMLGLVGDVLMCQTTFRGVKTTHVTDQTVTYPTHYCDQEAVTEIEGCTYIGKTVPPQDCDLQAQNLISHLGSSVECSEGAWVIKARFVRSEVPQAAYETITKYISEKMRSMIEYKDQLQGKKYAETVE
eukprot:TRINITY_DN86708_c0_g1_i1.p1 TRINITY_DN86708_c0_g1~~TRINITY_DN86708_c0_g1_i1.p1  ORF type:complete len:144 (-),score=1.12 TRINITY_DN86708_c0_g1_i1:2-403(-)